MNENIKGGLLMALGMGSITINDVFMRTVMGDLTLFQTLFLRSLPMIPMMLVYIYLAEGVRLRLGRRDWGLMCARAGLEVFAAYLFFSAILVMPFANLSAIMQALPLTVTLAAALFLGQSFGWKRLAAILIGFCGVLMIVQPGPSGFEDGALLALTCVCVVTLRDVLTRQLSRDVPSGLAALITAMAVGFGGGLLSIGQGWADFTMAHMGLLSCAAVFAVVAYIALLAAMRVGEIAFVAPFRYTSLVFAIVLGFLVFGERPGGWVLLGAALVIGTGLFTMYREHQNR